MDPALGTASGRCTARRKGTEAEVAAGRVPSPPVSSQHGDVDGSERLNRIFNKSLNKLYNKINFFFTRLKKL